MPRRSGSLPCIRDVRWSDQVKGYLGETTLVGIGGITVDFDRFLHTRVEHANYQGCDMECALFADGTGACRDSFAAVLAEASSLTVYTVFPSLLINAIVIQSLLL